MTVEIPPLAAGEVHLWRASLDMPAGHASALEACLSADERARAGRLREALDRGRYVAARGVLRRLLGRYMAMEAGDLRIEYGPRGKPEIALGEGLADLRFNVSHSGPLALYAFARGARVGVDLERVRPVPHAARVASRIFPPDELRAWSALPEEQRLEGFFSRWTRLEALAKLHGGGVWWLVGHGGSIPEAAGVSVLDIEAPPGYRAALAVEGGARAVHEMGQP